LLRLLLPLVPYGWSHNTDQLGAQSACSKQPMLVTLSKYTIDSNDGRCVQLAGT